MLRIVIGVFFILHGLVHLLYFGQGGRFFELQPGMVWPDGSWAFSGLLGNEATRVLASICCILAAAGFAAGGIGLLAKQPWWQTVVIAAAAFSAIIYILLWDGKMQKLADKGAVNILINIVILVALLVLHWPRFDL